MAAPALQRLTVPTPKQEPAKAPPKAPPKVARSPKSARDPRFMRKVDQLNGIQRAKPKEEEERPKKSSPPAVSRLVDARFSSVLGNVQTMQVSSPHDPAELEAHSTAKRVVTMPHPVPPPPTRPPPRAGVIARQAAGPTMVPRNVAASIARARVDGRPLPTHVRRFMEPRFGAEFGDVRIHTGEEAARLNRELNAHAFTVEDQIFFARNRFQPESQEGKELIAHELTHTIQQGAVTQEETPLVHRAVDVSSSTTPHVQRGILDWIADKANIIPGFRMFTIVIGVNPINMSSVDRSAANILRAVVEFLPGGYLITQALDKYGVFEKAGAWIEQQLDSLGISGASIKASIDRFIDSLGISDLASPGDAWERGKAIIADPINRIITFLGSLASKIIDMVKDAVLRPIAQLASQSDGWDLLCAVLARNPITGDPVARNAETLIGGFMKLIGQQEIWENIKKGNAIARAWAWFQGAVDGALAFIREFPTLFINTLKSLTLEDLINLPQGFAKVGRAFGNFIGRFFSWAGSTIWDLLEIIFSVVAPGVIAYVKKAAAAFRTILQNPIGFVRNLIAAGKQGLSQFVANFVKHLKAALIGWLTGALSGAGIYIPQGLTLLEIGKFVLSILGITWPKIREKIVKVIGETAMKAIETGLDIVIALVRGGPAAAWEIIKQKLSDLKDMVIQSIISFVKDKVVTAAVTKLLSLLSPVGAFIQAIIGIYNTVMFFIERMKQIAAVAASIIDSISAIANGVIGAAANKVEQTMAGLLTLVISFLARIAGLGKVSDAVVNFIKKVQAKVDQAIDAAIKFVVDKAKAFLKAIFGKKDKDKDKKKGGTKVKTFSLPEEGHTVTAVAQDKDIRVTIASDRAGEIIAMLMSAKSEVENDKSRSSDNKKTVVGDLLGAKKEVEEMKQDWRAAGGEGQDFEPWSEVKMTMIINALGALGGHGIKAFRDFIGQPLPKRLLPGGYDVRGQLYERGSGWSSAQSSVSSAGKSAVDTLVKDIIKYRTSDPPKAVTAWTTLKNKLQAPKGTTMATITLQDVANIQYDVDHITDLGSHWNTQGGNNTGDAARWALSQPGNLRYITQADNLARPRVKQYFNWVGPAFTSSYAQGGQTNAKQIDGQPFTDPLGKPI
jgi:hypothetical protein